MKTFDIEDKLFKTSALFIVGCSHETLDIYLNQYRFGSGLNCGQCGQMFTFDRYPWRVVWVKNRPRDAETFAVLLHEIFHLVTRICQDKGISIKAQVDEGLGDEAAAYLYEFFARESILELGLNITTHR